jgi:hypothetical protein
VESQPEVVVKATPPRVIEFPSQRTRGSATGGSATRPDGPDANINSPTVPPASAAPAPPAPAAPLARLTELAPADQRGSDARRELFALAAEVARETTRSLAAELFGQVHAGDSVDVRSAARSAIYTKLDEMRQATIAALDDAVRALIGRLPDDPRFDAEVYYSTFVSPTTIVLTPYDAKRNIGAYLEAMVGRRLDDFFGRSTP